MERPFYSIQKKYLQVFKRFDDTQKFQFEYYDKFILWVIGLAIASIALITTNTDKIYPVLQKSQISWVIILLVVSMISGVFYRMFFFGFRYNIISAIGFLESALVVNSDEVDVDAEELSMSDNIQVILDKLLLYFEEDLANLETGSVEKNKLQETALRKSLLDRYNTLRKWSKRDFYLGNIHVRDSICNAFNLSKKELKSLNAKKYNFLRYSKVCDWLLFLCVSSFIVSIIIFAVVFLINNASTMCMA